MASVASVARRPLQWTITTAGYWTAPTLDTDPARPRNNNTVMNGPYQKSSELMMRPATSTRHASVVYCLQLVSQDYFFPGFNDFIGFFFSAAVKS